MVQENYLMNFQRNLMVLLTIEIFQISRTIGYFMMGILKIIKKMILADCIFQMGRNLVAFFKMILLMGQAHFMEKMVKNLLVYGKTIN